jgi:hypothetical protein
VTDLVFDGSFDGVLCADRRALGEPGARIGAADGPAGSASADLFADVIRVPTDAGEAALLGDRIAARAGAGEIETMMLVHASAAAERHRLLLAYLSRTLAEGRSIAGDATAPVARCVLVTPPAAIEKSVPERLSPPPGAAE